MVCEGSRIGRLDELLPRLRSERPGLLLLDYDGTLAPFTENRLAAAPWPGVVATLGRIAARGRTRVLFVTGRPARELDQVAGLQDRFEVWGVHGRERLRPGRALELREPEPRAARGLELAAEVVSGLGRIGDLEIKTGALSFHARVDPALARDVARAWTPLLRDHDLEMFAFDGGVELRAQGVSKADVVAQARAEYARHPGLAFLGDDRTDEDAFAALEARDLGVLVRPAPRSTRARFWIRPPEELLALLDAWERFDGARG